MGKKNMLQQFIDVQEGQVKIMVENSNGRVQRETMEIEALQKVIGTAKAFLANGRGKEKGLFDSKTMIGKGKGSE